MELDRHALEEERRWRFDNYKRQVERLITMLVDAIQTEGRNVLEQEIRYDDDLRHDYSYTRQAGQLQHAILQAVNNADFGGLTQSAGDLHAVCEALFALSKMKAALPEGTRLALEQAEDDKLRGRIDEKVKRLEELDERDRVTCVAAVHQGGRGVGFHRCSKKGKHTFTVDKRPGHLGDVVKADDPNAIEILVCGTHAKEAERGHIHVYRPSEWEKGQHLAFRQKENREIAAMRRSLGELPAGETRKELGMGDA